MKSCLGSHEAEDARSAADLEYDLSRDGGGGEGGGVGRDAGRVLQHGAVDREPGVRLQKKDSVIWDALIVLIPLQPKDMTETCFARQIRIPQSRPDLNRFILVN